MRKKNPFRTPLGVSLALFAALPAPALFAQTPPSVPQNQDKQDRIDLARSDIELARQKVYPALVNIAVVFRFFNGGRAQRAPAGGSGVIVSPDGKILTNFHVAVSSINSSMFGRNS